MRETTTIVRNKEGKERKLCEIKKAYKKQRKGSI
jgi:hypothetical protein